MEYVDYLPEDDPDEGWRWLQQEAGRAREEQQQQQQQPAMNKARKAGCGRGPAAAEVEVRCASTGLCCGTRPCCGCGANPAAGRQHGGPCAGCRPA
jgi:hypothetical protein